VRPGFGRQRSRDSANCPLARFSRRCAFLLHSGVIERQLVLGAERTEGGGGATAGARWVHDYVFDVLPDREIGRIFDTPWLFDPPAGKKPPPGCWSCKVADVAVAALGRPSGDGRRFPRQRTVHETASSKPRPRSLAATDCKRRWTPPRRPNFDVIQFVLSQDTTLVCSRRGRRRPAARMRRTYSLHGGRWRPRSQAADRL
jgi:hypothetical protein